MVLPIEVGYKLSSDPIYEDTQLKRFATDDPYLFVETFEVPELGQGASAPNFDRYREIYDNMRERLLNVQLQSFVPEMVDADSDDCWAAFGVPKDLYTVSEFAKSYLGGITGRDWAWILRRMLMVLHKARRRPSITEENMLIHPEGHGLVLLGWQPVEDDQSYPLDEILEVMQRQLKSGDDTDLQINFVEKVSERFKKNRRSPQDLKSDPQIKLPLFGYDDVLREFEMLLEHLYGPRKFHKSKIDPALSLPYLQRESALLNS